MTSETPLCPECDGEVDIPSDAMENELLSCAECGTELEIMNLDPIELELAPEVEEDWGE
ncbi:MAG: lysine biosynthesis protein LysW [Chloroflexi bacterium]|nr:lysine biosynthesis protein LysW [Chloroflexota bacterium]MCY3978035.1 lysine biosynthesis protein LysW [Chloroflexota bacterium]